MVLTRMSGGPDVGGDSIHQRSRYGGVGGVGDLAAYFVWKLLQPGFVRDRRRRRSTRRDGGVRAVAWPSPLPAPTTMAIGVLMMRNPLEEEVRRPHLISISTACASNDILLRCYSCQVASWGPRLSSWPDGRG